MNNVNIEGKSNEKIKRTLEENNYSYLNIYNIYSYFSSNSNKYVTNKTNGMYSSLCVFFMGFIFSCIYNIHGRKNCKN